MEQIDLLKSSAQTCPCTNENLDISLQKEIVPQATFLATKAKEGSEGQMRLLRYTHRSSF